MLLSKLKPALISANWQLYPPNCSVILNPSLPSTSDLLSGNVSNCFTKQYHDCHELDHVFPCCAEPLPPPTWGMEWPSWLPAVFLGIFPTHLIYSYGAANAVFQSLRLAVLSCQTCQWLPMTCCKNPCPYNTADPEPSSASPPWSSPLPAHPTLTHSTTADLASVMFLEHARHVCMFPSKGLTIYYLCVEHSSPRYLHNYLTFISP